MKMYKAFGLALLLLIGNCLLLSAVSAQTTSATLSGVVLDEKDAAIPGVKITVANPATGLERTVQTDDSGAYIVPLLPPGTYTVSAEQTGFKRVQYPNIILNVNDHRSLRIQLTIGDLSAAIEVHADETLVKTSSEVSTTIDRTFVGNLPLNGRSFQSLILLTPGVVPTVGGDGGFSVNGQRSNANQFTVDGVSANVGVDLKQLFPSEAFAGTTPATTALGTTQNLVTVDALEEFKIQTSSYSAEFGRQPGGQVQIVTRSGNNTFHGSGFDYVRNEAFDANDWFSNRKGDPRPPLRQHLFGGSFSGPVFFPNFGDGGPGWYSGKNRTFFFFSYEGLRLLLPQTINGTVPSVDLRQHTSAALQPLLNAFSIPTGPEIFVSCLSTDPACQPNGTKPSGLSPFVASTSSPLRHDTVSLRIDHTINGKLSFFGRYSQTPSENLSRNPGFLTGVRTKSRVLTIGVAYVPSSTISNEFRFNYTRNRGRIGTTLDSFGGAVPFSLSQLVTGYTGADRVQGTLQFTVTAPGATGLIAALGDSVDSYNQQFQIVDNLSWVKGSHSFKFGIDYRRLTPRFGPVPYSQTVILNDAQQIRNGIARAVFVMAKQEAHPVFDNFSAYVQDTWKATKRLTLDLGLRWEFNPPPGEANRLRPLLVIGVENLPTATLAPAGSRLYKADYKAFAPRFGAIYQLIKKPGRETVLRGNIGVNYDQGNGLAMQGFNSFPFVAQNLIRQ